MHAARSSADHEGPVRLSLLGGEQGSPKYFAFNLHPFLTGVPYRTKIVDEFIKYAKGFPDVWFAKRIEIAEWCLKKSY
jgi:hypothetical protein